MKNRDTNIDIIRCFALLLVVSVHFFLWNGFYQMKMDGWEALLLCFLRTVSMSCVPLFLMITGYLLSGKNYLPLKMTYFKKLIYLLMVYLICTAICIFFRTVLLKEEMSMADIIINILSFSQYSWYVAMYAGLYALIPFLNPVWKRTEGTRDEIILPVLLVVLCALPSAVNIKKQIIPELWTGIYPVTYYFIGGFIKRRESRIRANKKSILLIWIICAVAFSLLNYRVSFGKIFAMGSWNDWGALQNIVLSVLMFVFLLKIDTAKMGSRAEKFFAGLSKLTYAAFMMSYISDITAWKIFKDIIPVNSRPAAYLPAVVVSFLLAAGMSWIINKVIDMAGKAAAKKGA